MESHHRNPSGMNPAGFTEDGVARADLLFCPAEIGGWDVVTDTLVQHVQALSQLDADHDLILSEDDEDYGRYIHMHIADEGFAHVDLSSNNTAGPFGEMSLHQELALIERGWEPPYGTEDLDGRNFTITFERIGAPEAAVRAGLEALVSVLGVPHDLVFRLEIGPCEMAEED